MKRIINILLIVLTLASATTFSATAKGNESKRTRAEWLKEMRGYKRDYLTRKLDLTKEQADRFFPIYYAMEDELFAIQSQTRDLTRQVEKKGKNASALEQEKAVDAIYELKQREGAIEMKYLPRFKEILTPAQLLRLKRLETKFARELMKHHDKKKKD